MISINSEIAVQCLEAVDAILLILNRQGEITFINQKGAALLGASPERLIGENWFECFIVEDERSRVWGLFQSLLNDEIQKIDNYQNRIKRIDGQIRHISFNNIIIRDKQDKISAVLSTGNDITSSKSQEELLIQRNLMFSIILDSIDAGITVSTLDTHEILFANEYIRRSHGDFRGKKCWEYLQINQPGPCIFCNNKEIVNQLGEPRGIIINRELKNTISGEWLDTRDQAIRWYDGRIVRLSVATNIQEKKEAERIHQHMTAQLQYAQKLESLGVLAGGIAHDFNNLLMTILGNTGLAMCDLHPTSPAKESLLEIEGAAKRAAELCRQMLAYSGRGRFLIESVDLRELIEEMTHLLKISVSKKAVLKFDFAQNVPKISADATQLRQVIMNLATNASEAIGDMSGLISISTGLMDCDKSYLRSTYLNEDLKEGLYAYIEVADTGIGMGEEVKARLFDPFFTTKFTGRGLGLSAVLGIIRSHHGAIKIYSEINRGTTFKVLFPVSETFDRLIENTLKSENNWRGKGIVLMVDDEESVRSVGKRMLERMGFEVITAEHGREAVSIFKHKHDQIHGVLMDLMMPHMDGEQAYREMRMIDPNVRVILSSGYNEQDVTCRFLGKSLSGFIQKPYQYEELLNIVKQAFS